KPLVEGRLRRGRSRKARADFLHEAGAEELAEVLLDPAHHRLAVRIHRRAASREAQACDPAWVFLECLARGWKAGKRQVVRDGLPLRRQPATRIACGDSELAWPRPQAEAIYRDDGFALAQLSAASRAAARRSLAAGEGTRGRLPRASARD